MNSTVLRLQGEAGTESRGNADGTLALGWSPYCQCFLNFACLTSVVLTFQFKPGSSNVISRIGYSHFVNCQHIVL